MSLYDNGRKPPLSQSAQQSSYANYDQPSNGASAGAFNMEMTDIVIIQTTPSNNNEVDEIACIILAGDLREKESFSVNFSGHNSFDGQADYILGSLTGRIWVIFDNERQVSSQRALGNAFKRLGKNPPAPSRVIDAALIFSAEHRRQLPSPQANARIRCYEIYATLQRVALTELLARCSPLSNVLSGQVNVSGMGVQPDYAQVQPEDPAQHAQWGNANVANYDSPAVNNYGVPVQTAAQVNVAVQQVNAPNINNAVNVPPPQVIPEQVNVVNDFNDVNAVNSGYGLAEQQVQQPPVIDQVQQVQEPVTSMAPVNVEPQQQEQQQQPQQVEQYTQEPMNGGPYAQQEADAQAAAAQEQMQRDQEAQAKQQQQQAQEEEVIPPAVVPNDFAEPAQPEPDMAQEQEPVQDQAQQVQPVQDQAQQASEKTQSPQSNSQAQAAAAPPANTWSAKLTAKSSWGGKSPNRTTRIQARDNVATKRVAKGPLAIKQTINQAILAAKNPNTLIYISYNGHQKPFIPRAIHPTKWAREKDSFLAIQHKSRSNTEQRFFLDKVLEVRNKSWRIPQHQLSILKQRYPNGDRGTWGPGGYQGGQGGQRPRG